MRNLYSLCQWNLQSSADHWRWRKIVCTTEELFRPDCKSAFNPCTCMCGAFLANMRDLEMCLNSERSGAVRDQLCPIRKWAIGTYYAGRSLCFQFVFSLQKFNSFSLSAIAIEVNALFPVNC